ncbi:MAG: hypothetical protein AMS20_00130 [Gemmatimonas sp. SG8_28]|nr:MAG: hypothetical protein AMS20_00130 [Gemmatimonas sp. SG8_28]
MTTQLPDVGKLRVTLMTGVKTLAQIRHRLEAIGATIEQAEKAHRERHAGLYDQQEELRVMLDRTERQVRQGAVEVFEMTGDLNPVEDVSIITSTEYEYNADIAKTWVMDQGFGGALTLKKGEFDKLCRSAAQPDFVRATEVHKARISRDLRDWLDPEETDGTD